MRGKQATIRGWIFDRQVKARKTFYRPMNRVALAHIQSIMPDDPQPNDPVFLGGGSRPNQRFGKLCSLAGIRSKIDRESGEKKPWLLQPSSLR